MSSSGTSSRRIPTAFADATRAGLPVRLGERRDVARHDRAMPTIAAVPDVAALVHGGPQAEIRAVADVDVSGQQNAGGERDAIREHAVVGDVAPGS